MMKKRKIFLVVFTLIISINFSFSENKNKLLNSSLTTIEIVYNSLETNNFKLPSLKCFSIAYKGFQLLANQSKINNQYLILIDFSLSSKSKRLWVIDLNKRKIIFNTLVAHGKNSGNDFACNFSNECKSNKSSLGFYKTAETYHGQHGLSLKLDGLEFGINNNARQRAIVIHGANYVSNYYIKNQNRLGRSQGCPALPVELSEKIIHTIKNNSCLFIYYPSKEYFKNSKLISNFGI